MRSWLAGHRVQLSTAVQYRPRPHAPMLAHSRWLTCAASGPASSSIQTEAARRGCPHLAAARAAGWSAGWSASMAPSPAACSPSATGTCCSCSACLSADSRSTQALQVNAVGVVAGGGAPSPHTAALCRMPRQLRHVFLCQIAGSQQPAAPKQVRQLVGQQAWHRHPLLYFFQLAAQAPQLAESCFFIEFRQLLLTQAAQGEATARAQGEGPSQLSASTQRNGDGVLPCCPDKTVELLSCVH